MELIDRYDTTPIPIHRRRVRDVMTVAVSAAWRFVSSGGIVGGSGATAGGRGECWR